MKRVVASRIKRSVEVQRNNVTPREFFSECKRAASRKGYDIEAYIEYDEWVNPSTPEPYHSVVHKDRQTSVREILKLQPYETQLYLEGSYNFILEFTFNDDKRGFGYMYLDESE